MLTTHVMRVLSPTSELKKRLVSTSPVSSPSSCGLPIEAALLKDHIRRLHPAKLYAFSLAHMRKLAVPPVAIPKTYRSGRSMVVGGRDVPFTRAMWDRSKRRLAVAQVKFRLHPIHEDVTYD